MTEKGFKKEGAAPSKLVDVGSRKQLFIDDALTASSQGIELTMNPPIKTGEKTLVADRPWEELGVGGYDTVLKVEDEYRYYYSTLYVPRKGHRKGGHEPETLLCLAVSQDGVHWEKPNLSLVAFNGSKENNIVFPPKPCWFAGAHLFMDTRPGIPDGEKFKMTCRWDGQEGKHWNHEWTLKSPDGLCWTPLSQTPSYACSDTGNIAFWDDRIGRYVVYVRENSWPYYAEELEYSEVCEHGKVKVYTNKPGWKKAGSDERPYFDMAYRKVGRCETDDLALWDKPENWGRPQTAFGFDEQDPAGLDIDNCAAVKYPWADNVYLMFPAAYCHYPMPPAGEYFNDGIFDVRLATSRDGNHFNTISRSPFVPLGLAGDFDSGLVGMTVGIIRQGGELWLFYHGRDDVLRHGAGPIGVWYDHPSHVSRLVLRLDGFVSADAPYKGGELTTLPLKFDGKSLELNVQTSVAGHVLVEILRNGEPIQGYSVADADPIKGNFIDKTVTWNGQSDVSSLAGEPVQVRFVMRDAKLYAFQFMAS